MYIVIMNHIQRLFKIIFKIHYHHQTHHLNPATTQICKLAKKRAVLTFLGRPTPLILKN